jgi:hypothetical protein
MNHAGRVTLIGLWRRIMRFWRFSMANLRLTTFEKYRNSLVDLDLRRTGRLKYKLLPPKAHNAII